jgi:hypothetical protein
MGRTVDEPRHRQLNTPLSEREHAALCAISAQTGMSKPAVMRMGLRYYQLLLAHPALLAQVTKATSEALGPKLNPEASL